MTHKGRSGGRRKRGAKGRPKKSRPINLATPEQMAPDFTRKCTVCGATPVVTATGNCGPCTFGDLDTAGGNW